MSKTTSLSFDARLNRVHDQISPAELKVARYVQEYREEALIASASLLAERIGTSDATVVRTAQALGFVGLKEMRQAVAADIRDNPSPATRMSRTLSEVGSDLDLAFGRTMEIHESALADLRRDITPDRFRAAIELITTGKRIFIFGIGPSSAMAEYFSVQLARFGFDTRAATNTGLLLADDIRRLGKNDLLVLFAYGRIYREVTVLLDQAAEVGAGTMLISDSLGRKLRERVDLTLPVARGRTDMLSMHTATLALIEAILVGVAAARPKETVASLQALNGIRAQLAGADMNL